MHLFMCFHPASDHPHISGHLSASLQMNTSVHLDVNLDASVYPDSSVLSDISVYPDAFLLHDKSIHLNAYMNFDSFVILMNLCIFMHMFIEMIIYISSSFCKYFIHLTKCRVA